MDRRAVALAASLTLAAGCGAAKGGSGAGFAATAGPPAVLDERATSIHVTADHAPGLAPRSESLALLEARLREWTGKPVTVRLGRELPSAARERWSDDALRALDASSGVRSVGSVAAVHVLLVDGASDRDVEGTPLLGLSLGPSSFAVFARTVREDRPASVSAAELEAAVLVHEAGHLAGLGHCLEEGCIMRALSTGWDFERVDLGAGCRADLARSRAF